MTHIVIDLALIVYPIHKDYEEGLWQLTLVRSPTPTMNSGDLTLPTRTQTSEQEYSDLAAINRRPSTSYSGNTPRNFTRGTHSNTFSGQQDKSRRLWHIPRISRKFGGEWKLAYSAMGGTKTALDSFQLCLIMSWHLFSRHKAHTFPGRLRREMTR